MYVFSAINLQVSIAFAASHKLYSVCVWSVEHKTLALSHVKHWDIFSLSIDLPFGFFLRQSLVSEWDQVIPKAVESSQKSLHSLVQGVEESGEPVTELSVPEASDSFLSYKSHKWNLQITGEVKKGENFSKQWRKDRNVDSSWSFQISSAVGALG